MTVFASFTTAHQLERAPLQLDQLAQVNWVEQRRAQLSFVLFFFFTGR